MFREAIPYDKIERGSVIGKGTFGKVYRCRYKGHPCALKTLAATDRLRAAQRKKHADSLRLEARTLAKLGRCDNIVHYFGCCVDPKLRLCILMELVSGKNLARFIEEEFPKHPWALREAITLDIARGVTFIHSKGIIHRDLKSENILIDDAAEFKAKIADFGVAKVSEEVRGTIETFLGAGSPPWMAPELFLNPKGLPTKKTDIYSFGMIMWEMATEKRPYEERSREEIRQMKEQGTVEEVPPAVPPTYERMLVRCMDHDPQNRDVDRAEEQSPSFNRAAESFACDSDSDSELNCGSKLERLLSSLSQGDEDAKDKLFEEYDVDPQDEMSLELSLGNCHYKGLRVPVNYAVAAKHYEKAAMLGSKEAVLRLGICYKLGQGKPTDLDKAFQMFSEAAAAGVSGCYGQLGECYFNGDGTEASVEAAIRAFKAGAVENDATAHLYLGRCYYSGLGVPKDYQRAVKHFAAAAHQGHAGAQLNVGIIHKAGIAKPMDDAEAFRWFLKSAEQNNATAQNNAGSCYYFGVGVTQNFTHAARWFKASAAQGNPGGMHNLADCYLNGQGVELDVEKAAEYFLNAANSGHSFAQNSLGRCYLEGRGVPRDAEAAVYWIRKAAESENVQGQYGLGVCYRDGVGVAKDLERAMHWLERAADQGLPQAQVALAMLHLDQGNGGEKCDPLQAFRWFHTAAENGDGNALFHLGRCYVMGLGIEKDFRRGFNCFVKAATRDHAEAQNTLGSFYYQGTVTPVDYTEAVRWFTRAALAGHTLAEYNLAECYLRGRGVAQSTESAIQLYSKAANKHHAPAQYALGSVYELGRGVAADVASALRYYRMAAHQLPQAQRRADYLTERHAKPLPTPLPPPPPNDSACGFLIRIRADLGLGLKAGGPTNYEPIRLEGVHQLKGDISVTPKVGFGIVSTRRTLASANPGITRFANHTPNLTTRTYRRLEG
ncbi:Receptor-interacting serine/threonine-protein kinase 1 [Massospora cicadina]|nr:Receptor-interacting serine/threonine-protein kinase 1 [Massospora cicadina]